MRALLTIFLGMIAFVNVQLVSGQDLFDAVYPIGDGPNIGYKSSMVPEVETIIFEANPTLRLPIYNNFQRRFMNGEATGSSLYFGFEPQIRMYNDVSKPVRMPSYKISILGYQQLFRLPQMWGAHSQFLALAVESGHYSNGQAGCAFSNSIQDGSAGCDSVYQQIDDDTELSEILNRANGNFSTNYTELVLRYFVALLDGNYRQERSYSVTLGYNRYHNDLLFLADIGGFTAEDIRIYGRNRIFGSLEAMMTLEKEPLNIHRVNFRADCEYISQPHPSVQPWRLELGATVYFKNNVGLFARTIFGHDNYNYRFVDRGFQLFLGMTYDVFPPMELK